MLDWDCHWVWSLQMSPPLLLQFTITCDRRPDRSNQNQSPSQKAYWSTHACCACVNFVNWSVCSVQNWAVLTGVFTCRTNNKIVSDKEKPSLTDKIWAGGQMVTRCVLQSTARGASSISANTSQMLPQLLECISNWQRWVANSCNNNLINVFVWEWKNRKEKKDEHCEKTKKKTTKEPIWT